MSRKTLIIADDDDNEADTNPFSFRQFLRAKTRDPDEDCAQVQEHGEEAAARVQGRDLCQQETTSSFVPVDEESEAPTSCGQILQVTPPPTHPAQTVCTCSCVCVCEKLQQENRILKGIITDLQTKLHKEEQRAERLSRQLSERQRREEKEAGVLEDVVQSVEQNLEQMTKRAKKSESHVTKLKSEVTQLQIQVQSLQLDNERLKASHSDVVMAMKHNTHLASEYLNKTVSHAHSSLRRLQDETETLHLISQLLQSIDRISELNPPTHAQHTHTA
ncbi:endosome-associated-trafficking regulator 1 isoform X1 [Synchiropus splendidus]|uniref:endosome-associated-trafficking regulator 1 isoform X1 n=1 Tax=Synchiropus splendidus TaxID=270530 RepID=UPI00237EC811|nr:endosome-associated-trafficking regulator 1 isoform X1 [Synchiropus splendidus]